MPIPANAPADTAVADRDVVGTRDVVVVISEGVIMGDKEKESLKGEVLVIRMVSVDVTTTTGEDDVEERDDSMTSAELDSVRCAVEVISDISEEASVGLVETDVLSDGASSESESEFEVEEIAGASSATGVVDAPRVGASIVTTGRVFLGEIDSAELLGVPASESEAGVADVGVGRTVELCASLAAVVEVTMESSVDVDATH